MAKANDKTKEAKAAAKTARKVASKERRQQFWQAFTIQRKEDKWLLPLMFGAFAAIVGIAVGLGFYFGQLIFFIPLGIILGVLAGMIIFGQRVQRSVYRKAEGQPGAAAWALENLRGQWRVNKAVAATTSLDAIHRVIGRPGIILVAEGSPTRTKSLLAQEKKKISRVAGDTPIYEVHVGNDTDQISLKDLQKHISKLPNNIDRKRMDALEGRLSALSGRQAGPGIPKGPMPSNAKMKGMQRTARRKG